MARNFRASILKGASAASKIHFKYNLTKADSPFIDVFEAIQREGIFLSFAPLEKIHGAFIPSPNRSGILINEKHPIQVQRFTAAHELGHYVLGHKPSVDLNMLGRAPLESDKYGGFDSDPIQESEADNFASSFLIPKWLIAKHLSFAKADAKILHVDVYAYQMSLRLGVSYQAFCWSLFGHDIVSFDQAKLLAGRELKEIKRKIIPKDILDKNPYGNVWMVSEKTARIRMLGDKGDFLVVSLEERPSTGYIWDYSILENRGLKLVHEDGIDSENGIIGGDIRRRIIFTNEDYISASVNLPEKRPWNDDVYRSVTLDMALNGRRKGFYSKVKLSHAA